MFPKQHWQIACLQGRATSTQINPKHESLFLEVVLGYVHLSVLEKQVVWFTVVPGNATGGCKWPCQPLVTSSHAHILSM